MYLICITLTFRKYFLLKASLVISLTMKFRPVVMCIILPNLNREMSLFLRDITDVFLDYFHRHWSHRHNISKADYFGLLSKRREDKFNKNRLWHHWRRLILYSLFLLNLSSAVVDGGTPFESYESIHISSLCNTHDYLSQIIQRWKVKLRVNKYSSSYYQ
jgi:hypothetical protein